MWLAIKTPEPHELAEIQEEFDRHHHPVETSLHDNKRPKLRYSCSWLFTVSIRL